MRNGFRTTGTAASQRGAEGRREIHVTLVGILLVIAFVTPYNADQDQHQADSLTGFYLAHSAEIHRDNVKPGTIKKVLDACNWWRRLGPACSIYDLSRHDLMTFRSRMMASELAEPTIRAHIVAINQILGHAFPAIVRRRAESADDMRAMLDVMTAFLDRSSLNMRPPVIDEDDDEMESPAVPSEVAAAWYDASDAADWPVLDGVSPGQWWRAAFVTYWNLAVRFDALVSIRIEDIDWVKRRVKIRPEGDKRRRRRLKPLNATVLQHWMAIRGDRTLLFDFPLRRRPKENRRTDQKPFEPSFYKELGKIRKAAIKIDSRSCDYKPHDFRRSFTDQLENMVDPQPYEWIIHFLTDHKHASTVTGQSYAVDKCEKSRQFVDRIVQPWTATRRRKLPATICS